MEEITDHKVNIKKANQELKLNPSNMEAYYNRGFALLMLDKPKEATKDFDTYLKHNPKSVEAYYYKGVACDDQEKYKEAIVNYSLAISIDVEDCKSYFNRGVSKYSLGKYEDAILDFNIAINLDPEDGDMYHNRGYTYLDLGMHNEALADIKKEIELLPLEEGGYIIYASILGEMMRLKEGVEILSAGIKLMPDFGKAYSMRGVFYMELNQQSLACKDFKKASELGDDLGKGFLKQYCR